MSITVSLSAYQSWQRCEQQYYYSYVKKLRPVVKDIAPERGTLLHEYLSAYYSGLRDGMHPVDADAAGLEKLETHAAKLKEAASVAFYAGDDEVALSYQTLLEEVIDTAARYYMARGEADAERYEVLMVEERIELKLFRGITSASVIDLVVRDRHSGYIWLTEHKTAKSIPDSAVRIRDFQTMLYARVLEHLDYHVDGILWNYIRTKMPDKPHQNKDGRFSRAIAIDTTWSVYESVVAAAGQNPEHYADVRQRLEGNDYTVWFPRYEHVVVSDADLLLEDYAREALNMRRAQTAWQSGEVHPIRSLRRDCDFCAYYRLCEAAITGGDEEDVIRMRFMQGGHQ